ncbi:MAG: hypothetical protein K9W45_11725 [Candidatus Heimdallarchaeum aukensis]|uniref:Uncharacterized protein n=1 Tax=Candidatus Heimdallarchaeum aukensis TaxID=2876573 RepID=A0A9Y1BKG2_9ARCH|nr:MAG: hypothetical protein K9W45_11725 [Candidatus Heimdallarchaeum aukensis]
MSEGSIQEIIREVKELFNQDKINEVLEAITKKSLELEKNEKYLESTILWNFLADISKEDYEDLYAFALAKLITRYLYLNELEKAKEIYDLAESEEIVNFHLHTAKRLYKEKLGKKENREIIEILKRDVFGDYVPVLSSPSVMFNSLTQIKKYVTESLEEGTYKLSVYNYSSDTIEEIEVSTEKTVEYQVISINERIVIGEVTQ